MRRLRSAIVIVAGVLASAKTAGDAGFLGKSLQQWQSELAGRDPRSRRAAAFALGEMGVDAYDAVPGLMLALDDPDAGVREAAAFAVGDIGPAAGAEPAERLAKLLTQDKDARVRRSAAYALGSLGPANVASADALRKALGDPEGLVRQNAAWALGQLGHSVPGQPEPGSGAASVPELAHALLDEDALVRRDAADALGAIGRRAHTALRGLVKSLQQDRDPLVRKVP